MPRIARLVVKGEKTVYHVMSRTALAGYVLEDVEKDFLLRHIRLLSKVYFAEVLGFCIMGEPFSYPGSNGARSGPACRGNSKTF